MVKSPAGTQTISAPSTGETTTFGKMPVPGILSMFQRFSNFNFPIF
jgi:hypothetical protein